MSHVQQVLGHDRAQKALETDDAIAWAVISVSANFIGLYGCEAHAENMLRDRAAPKDAVMFPLVKSGPGTAFQGMRNALRAVLFQVVQGKVLERDACVTQARTAYFRAGGTP